MFPKSFWIALALLISTLTAARAQTPAPAPQIAKLTVTSTAFKDGGVIPIPNTCSGLNVSPALAWDGVPAGTETFAILCDDPDAGYKSFNHWVVFNIPKTVRSLAEKVPTDAQLKDGSLQGFNDFKKIGYRGPCPPTGTHRYIFRVFAIDRTLLLLGNVDGPRLEEALKGHILAQGQLVGIFRR